MKNDSVNHHGEPHDPDQDLYDDPDDVMFARAVAAPLRAPEQLRPGFEDRMLNALRAEHTAPRAGSHTGLHAAPLRVQRRPHWWHRTMTLTPITLFAIAASVAGVVSLTTLALARTATRHVSLQQVAQGSRDASAPKRIAGIPPDSTQQALRVPPPASQDIHDTVYIVRFVFADAQAQRVSLVGDFNGWSKHVTPLRVASRPGVWSADVPLQPGRHEYAFVIDGKRWSPDPTANRVSDDFGTESSVVVVGGEWRSPSSSL